jgi:hypothetical protein
MHQSTRILIGEKEQQAIMPATIKAAAAAARAFAGGAIGIPLLAGGVILEKK